MKSRHKLFPLFHNGITVIADKIHITEDRIRIENYFVVNGCQSLSELHNNGGHLTDDLRILVKLIKIESSSPLSELVTTFSNNQNGVKARDFKSNNPIQIRLQNEIRRKYGSEFHYEVKRGEDSKGLTTIANEAAGLLLLAFDLKRPWVTHRKYQIFEDDHAEVFWPTSRRRRPDRAVSHFGHPN
jgi:AIPR protein